MLAKNPVRHLMIALAVVFCFGQFESFAAEAAASEESPQSRLLALELVAGSLNGQDNKTRETTAAELKLAYESLINEHQDYFPAVLSYARFLSTTGELQQAIGVLNGNGKSSSDPFAQRLLGEIQLRIGNEMGAAKAFDKVAKITPDSASDHFHLANVLMMFRNHLVPDFGTSSEQVMDLAITHYLQARELAPQSLPMARAYAESFYFLDQERWPEALKAWQYCSSLDPSPFSDIHQARILIKLEDFAAATRVLNAIQEKEYQNVKERLLGKIEENQQQK